MDCRSCGAKTVFDKDLGKDYCPECKQFLVDGRPPPPYVQSGEEPPAPKTHRPVKEVQLSEEGSRLAPEAQKAPDVMDQTPTPMDEGPGTIVGDASGAVYSYNMPLISIFLTFIFLGVPLAYIAPDSPTLNCTVSFAIVILGVFLVRTDAEEIGAGSTYDENGLKPGTWAILVFFVFIVAMPLYLIMRRGIWDKTHPPVQFHCTKCKIPAYYDQTTRKMRCTSCGASD